MAYSHGFKWTKEAKAELERKRNLGLKIREIARDFGISVNSIKMAIVNYDVRKPEKKLEIPDLKKIPSDERLLDFIATGAELVRRFDPRQREVFPRYITDKWIGLACDGDWHFDHYKSDLLGIAKILDSYGAEKELFWLFNGDAGDWADIRFKDMNLPSNIVPIEIRYRALNHLIDKIHNLLAVTAGCHDDWLKNRGWYDIISAIKKRSNEAGFKTYYLGYGGIVNFTVGKAEYKIAMHHKLPGESMHNIFHPCMRYLKENDSTSDIVICSHRHDKMGISYQYYQHKPRILVRTGGRQYLTDYAWKQGFEGAINRIPVILLNGAKKEMVAMPDLKEGIRELRRLNNG